MKPTMQKGQVEQPFKFAKCMRTWKFAIYTLIIIISIYFCLYFFSTKQSQNKVQLKQYLVGQGQKNWLSSKYINNTSEEKFAVFNTQTGQQTEYFDLDDLEVFGQIKQHGLNQQGQALSIQEAQNQIESFRQALEVEQQKGEWLQQELRDTQNKLQNTNQGQDKNAQEEVNGLQNKKQQFFIPYTGSIKDQVRQILEKHASKDGYIIQAASFKAYTDINITRSFVHTLRKQGINNFFIEATDEYTYVYLQQMNVPTIFLAVSGSRFLTDIARLNVAQYIAELGYSSVFSEIDVFWLSNPFDVMRKNPDVDILVGIECQDTSVEDEGFETSFPRETRFQIGMLMLKHSSQNFIKAWIHYMHRAQAQGDYMGSWDQRAFWILFGNSLQEPTVNDHRLSNVEKRYFTVFKSEPYGPLTAAILNGATYSDGHLFSIQHLAESRGYKIEAVHFNYAWGMQKVHRMRESQLMDDEDAYYDVPFNKAGFISFKLNVSQQMLEDSRPREKGTGFRNFANHFKLVHWQLKQMRTAMALAQIFNRVVVFDDVWSGADKFWWPADGYPHDGAIPSAQNMTLPFKAPLDILIEVDQLYNRYFDENRFGPHIEFREAGYFANPRVNQSLVNNRVNIHTCYEGELSKCYKSDSLRHRFLLNPPLTESNIKSQLEDIKDIKVWHFPDMSPEILSSFDNPQDQEKFLNRMREMPARFCCARGEFNPYWTFYDMLWDIIPHEDKFGRIYNEEWVPLNGEMTYEQVAQKQKELNDKINNQRNKAEETVNT